MSNHEECPTCGAGRNEETDSLYADLERARTEVASLRGALDGLINGVGFGMERIGEPAGERLIAAALERAREAIALLAASPAVPGRGLDPCPDCGGERFLLIREPDGQHERNKRVPCPCSPDWRATQECDQCGAKAGAEWTSWQCCRYPFGSCDGVMRSLTKGRP